MAGPLNSGPRGESVPDVVYEPYTRGPIYYLIYPIVAVVAFEVVMWLVWVSDWDWDQQAMTLLGSAAWWTAFLCWDGLHIRRFRWRRRRIFLEGTTCSATVLRKRFATYGHNPLDVEYTLCGHERISRLHVPESLYLSCAIGDVLPVRALAAEPFICVLWPQGAAPSQESALPEEA